MKVKTQNFNVSFLWHHVKTKNRRTDAQMTSLILFCFFIVYKTSTDVTCDQASLIFFVAAGRYAWYNYLTICLFLVQNLDFSLIGQETKRYLELSHDWLSLWRLTCDQASLIFFVAAGRYAWYNYLTICLLLVQNLDFSLIGQETKRYLELSHDWLTLWRYDFR